MNQEEKIIDEILNIMLTFEANQDYTYIVAKNAIEKLLRGQIKD